MSKRIAHESAPIASRKRAFERRDGELLDRYEEKASVVLQAPLFGTAPIEVRGRRRSIKELVRQVEADDRGAGGDLVERCDEPRVRVAVAQLAKRTKIPNASLRQTLGVLGGPESRAALDRALRWFAKSKKTFAADESWNRTAQQAATVARAILELDRDADEAAALLVRLFRHPTPYNRMWAVWQATTAYADARYATVHTRAMRRLGTALRPVARDKDEAVFIKAIPALWVLGRKESELMVARCKRILRGPDRFHRQETIANLLRCRWPFEHLALVLDWFEYEPSVRLKLEVARTLRGLVAEPAIVELCRRGLADASPSLRYEALGLIDTVDRRHRRQLLSVAVRDEPDPELRVGMKRMLRRSSP